MMVCAETMQRRWNWTFRLLTVICLILVGLTTYSIAQVGKRLILKDGTWQGITQYEVRGDRARYFSSQRGEWEEVPTQLVDWKATEEWNAGLNQTSPELRQFDAEEEVEAEGSGPSVAPGLKLPIMCGVFVLDTFSDRPSLEELTQNGSALKSNLRSAVNRRASIIQQFELNGPHAHVQAHVPVPQIFVNIEKEPNAHPTAFKDRFRILRLEPKKDSRVLGRVKVSVLGEQNQSLQFVPARVESFSEGWLKVTPLGTLDSGEYALVEMLGQNEFNSYVWDFGVDANAPANSTSGKTDTRKP